MFPNQQLRWAGPSSNYTHTETATHTASPFWRSAIVVFALVATAFTATTATINVLASKEVAYQPSLNSHVEAAPAVAPEPPQASQPAAAASGCPGFMGKEPFHPAMVCSSPRLRYG
jgi:anti-sigma-K factor RskA